MKSLIVTISFFFLSMASFAQSEIVVPELLETKFNDKFEASGAQVSGWELLDKGMYRVNFDHERKFKYIIYTAEGREVENGMFIEKDVVSDKLVQMFMKKFNLLSHDETYASTAGSKGGYLLVGEDEENRFEMFVSESGQVYRTYKRPRLTAEDRKKKAEKLIEEATKEQEVKWD